jgi:hypothetical protein
MVPATKLSSPHSNIELCSGFSQPMASTGMVNTWSHVRHTRWIVSVSEKGLSWTGAVAMSVVALHWGQRKFAEATRSDAGITWTEQKPHRCRDPAANGQDYRRSARPINCKVARNGDCSSWEHAPVRLRSRGPRDG